jgi:tRNA pseudouridine13 synthase
LSVPKIDELLGMGVYGTETAGIGGVIRESINDFLVEEVLVDGSKARIKEVLKNKVLGATRVEQRYLLCVLVKHNWEAFITLRNIAKQLGISQRRIQIAGIKDAKAVTAQFVTIENCSFEDISKIGIREVEVRPIGYVRDVLSPYYLLGNSFAIRIKAVRFSESTVEKRLAETIRKLDAIGGIPNFFGHQRFGTTRPITHLVGEAIVKGDFEEAAMLFLAKPSIHEHPSSKQARKELQSTRNFKQALQDFPKQLRFEKLMLRHLVEKSGDFIGAFGRLPTKLQRFFVHAHQSYLFNRFLSERIKNGISLNEAEVGDFVLNIERSGLPMFRTAKFADAKNISEINNLVKTGRMRVALPLVGFKQRLSRGPMGRIEKEILNEENVETANFELDAAPDMSGRGSLRAVVTPLREFQKLGFKKCETNRKELHVNLNFMLLRGSYATALLREAMKPTDPIYSGF